MSNLEEAHKSILEALLRLKEEAKDQADSYKSLQLISHVDVRNICWFLDHSRDLTMGVIDMQKKLAEGISATIGLLKSGGNRDAAVASLMSALKDAGYPIDP